MYGEWLITWLQRVFSHELLEPFEPRKDAHKYSTSISCPPTSNLHGTQDFVTLLRCLSCWFKNCFWFIIFYYLFIKIDLFCHILILHYPSFCHVIQNFNNPSFCPILICIHCCENYSNFTLFQFQISIISISHFNRSPGRNVQVASEITDRKSYVLLQIPVRKFHILLQFLITGKLWKYQISVEFHVSWILHVYEFPNAWNYEISWAKETLGNYTGMM